jgi:hypothetical protein
MVVNDGGATIDTYSIEMDHGVGFLEVSIEPLLTSPVVISNSDVTSGSYLTFRYRARNVHGWSEYSDTFVIVAATIPDVPTKAATISDFLSSSMTFQWAEPVNTGGTAVLIDEYWIKVLKSDGVTFTDLPAGCNPDSAAVVAAQHCQVEMILLREDPFFL